MSRLNQLQIIGRNGKDAVLRYAGDTPVASWSVAVDAYRREGKPQWFECSWFGNRAEKVHQYIEKGAQIMVIGEVSLREWEGRSSLAVRVSDVVFLSRPQRDTSDRFAARGDEHKPRQTQDWRRREPEPEPEPEPKQQAFVDYPDDDDIPF